MQERHFKKLTITLPPNLLKALDDYSVTYGSTRSGIIQTALHDWLYIQKQYEPRNGVVKQQSKKRKVIPSAEDQGVRFSEYVMTTAKGMDLATALRAYQSETYEDED